MKNLRSETMSILSKHGKTWDDVIGVCGNEFQITKEQFLELSDILYHNRYGKQVIAYDLKIVGKDFWLERNEEDGLECWEFKQIPDIANLPTVSIDTLINKKWGYQSLKQCN